MLGEMGAPLRVQLETMCGSDDPGKKLPNLWHEWELGEPETQKNLQICREKLKRLLQFKENILDKSATKEDHRRKKWQTEVDLFEKELGEIEERLQGFKRGKQIISAPAAGASEPGTTK